MSAYKTSTKDGYVVVWREGYNTMPLRCFGDFQSAAIEFCRMLNNEYWERKPMQIKGWAKTFNPAEKYSYPEMTQMGIRLKKQRGNGQTI